VEVKDYDRKQIDSITLEPFGKGPVVELSCTSKAIRCIFLKSTATRSLASNGICPGCKQRYPTYGQQPTGSMRINPSFGSHCAGSPGMGSYVISYSFGGGTQTDRNLRPGESFQGTSRTCYVPMTAEGKEAVDLLKIAFTRGHLFRIGDSVTTGSKNQTVWAGIHQKTQSGGGQTNHGWPDPGYFGRLRNECAACGVFSEDFLKAAEDDRKKWKIARQVSAEKKEAAGISSDGEDTSKTAASPAVAAAPALDAAAEALVMSIEQQLAEVAKELAAAMKARDRKQIMKLMGKRRDLAAKKVALKAT